MTRQPHDAVPEEAVYREPGFLDAAACLRIRRAMDDGQADEAEVIASEFARDDEVRRAVSIEVAPGILREVETALESCRARLADFFGLPLGDREGCGFVRYPDGGFYTPHRDRAWVDAWPAAARRAIAVVVFLNGCRGGPPDPPSSARGTGDEGTFSGGTLRIYAAGTAIDVVPRTGLLAAFRADAWHEVTRVTGGTRDAIVDWFYEPEAT